MKKKENKEQRVKEAREFNAFLQYALKKGRKSEKKQVGKSHT